MDSGHTHIEIRRPWRNGEPIFLIGPGGVGKSTLGRELAPLLGWPLVDLDLAFCDRIGVIGPFIAAHSYERYRAENLALADALVSEARGPMVLVTSSGFLAAPQGTAGHIEARRLVGTGYAITLLPSLDEDAATSVVVARQLTRGFGFEQLSEERKFRDRFRIYRTEGQMLVVSVDRPSAMAEAVQRHLVGAV